MLKLKKNGLKDLKLEIWCDNYNDPIIFRDFLIKKYNAEILNEYLVDVLLLELKIDSVKFKLIYDEQIEDICLFSENIMSSNILKEISKDIEDGSAEPLSIEK